MPCSAFTLRRASVSDAQALRKGYGCTLPVEIAYRGDQEIDPETRRTLSKAFQPLFWLDLDAQQYPRHHYR